jgi:hypothetical protein
VKNKITLLTIATIIHLGVADGVALQKKEVSAVSSDALIGETQTGPKDAGDDHTCLVWWIPQEFWEGMMSRDNSLPEETKAKMLKAVEGVSILAIVQADISHLGGFDFYPEEMVSKNLIATRTNATGNHEKIPVKNDINSDLEVVLASFKPVLATAMGRMGDNMHFFVLDDVADGGGRRLDPYKGGNLKVRLLDKGGRQLFSEIPMPLNCLFEPRYCPNGKEAHVSWNFCPWTGEKLAP